MRTELGKEGEWREIDEQKARDGGEGSEKIIDGGRLSTGRSECHACGAQVVGGLLCFGGEKVGGGDQCTW